MGATQSAVNVAPNKRTYKTKKPELDKSAVKAGNVFVPTETVAWVIANSEYDKLRKVPGKE